MKTHHWSQGLFLLGLAALTAAIIPACGGGSSGSAGATPPVGASAHGLYSSSVAGPVVIPANSTNAAVRTVTFTPANPNDFILYAVVEGSYTNPAGSLQFVTVTIKDGSGNVLSSGPITSFLTASLQQFRWRAQVGSRDGTDPSSFPSSSYTITVTANTSAAGTAQIDSTKVRVFVAQDVTVEDPSTKLN